MEVMDVGTDGSKKVNGAALTDSNTVNQLHDIPVKTNGLKNETTDSVVSTDTLNKEPCENGNSGYTNGNHDSDDNCNGISEIDEEKTDDKMQRLQDESDLHLNDSNKENEDISPPSKVEDNDEDSVPLLTLAEKINSKKTTSSDVTMEPISNDSNFVASETVSSEVVDDDLNKVDKDADEAPTPALSMTVSESESDLSLHLPDKEIEDDIEIDTGKVTEEVSSVEENSVVCMSHDNVEIVNSVEEHEEIDVVNDDDKDTIVPDIEIADVLPNNEVSMEDSFEIETPPVQINESKEATPVPSSSNSSPEKSDGSPVSVPVFTHIQARRSIRPQQGMECRTPSSIPFTESPKSAPNRFSWSPFHRNKSLKKFETKNALNLANDSPLNSHWKTSLNQPGVSGDSDPDAIRGLGKRKSVSDSDLQCPEKRMKGTDNESRTSQLFNVLSTPLHYIKDKIGSFRRNNPNEDTAMALVPVNEPVQNHSCSIM